MNFTSQDIDRGYKTCGKNGCTYKNILQAGTDYPEQCWIKCESCDAFVVDESKDKE